jgi:hypothetical protein
MHNSRTQNPVQMADFPNDPFHIEIERLSNPSGRGTREMVLRARTWTVSGRPRVEGVLSKASNVSKMHTASGSIKLDLAKYPSSWDQVPIW